MWWTEHAWELGVIVATVAGFARLSVQLAGAVKSIDGLAKTVALQNGRIGKNELAMAELRGRWDGVAQERESQERQRLAEGDCG